MSTIVVSNIHFESSGNNRIQVEGSNPNVSIYQGGQQVLSVNSSHITLSNSSSSVTAMSNPQPIGTIVTTLSSANSSYLALGNTYDITVYSDLANALNYKIGNYWVTRTPSTTSLTDIVYGNGIYVTGGAAGAISSSSDGIVWTNQTTANTNSISALFYGNGLFIAGGSGGAIQTSTNGINWTNRTSANTNGQIAGIAYGQGVYVAAGFAGSRQSSTDGINWTNRASPIVNTVDDVVYGNGIFVLLAYGTIQTSTDGINWPSWISAVGSSYYKLTYNNGLFIAVGDFGGIKTSTNGTTWTTRTSANTANNRTIGFGNNMYVIGGANGLIQTSTDGITWYNKTSPHAPTSSNYIGVTYGNAFLLVGSNMMAATPNNDLFYVPSVSTANLASTNYNTLVKAL